MKAHSILLCVAGCAGLLLSTANAQMATTNEPPFVALVQPTNGAVFLAPVDVPLVAIAADKDGSVAGVQFFANDRLLGPGVPSMNPGATNTWSFKWLNPMPGTYIVRARAMDNLGAVRAPMGVSITVVASQPPPPPPPPQQTAVCIRPTDSFATEPCTPTSPLDPARFTVYRMAPTNDFDLPVYYSVGGTASNGVDYIEIPQMVLIPKGQWTADIIIVPKADTLVEGSESVVVRLMPPICTAQFPPAPECYLVGQPADAAVYIRDCSGAGQPPLVQILKPMNGAVLPPGINLGIVANTMDADGYAWKVEFFAGDTRIGQQERQFTVAPTNGTMIRYEMMWSNLVSGSYVLTARATDNQGLVGISAPVSIRVGTDVPPTITNRPPVISLLGVDPLAIEGTNCWSWSNPTNRWPGSTNCISLGSGTVTPVWWFTNCGPKSATLAVRREGDTNAELSVVYRVGGTATNGVDYDFLPGSITIPAGARRADIVIVPKADDVPEAMKTVIVSLVPPPVADATTPPPYFVSPQNRAGAIIIDSSAPRLASGPLPDKCFHLGTGAIDGAWYRIDYSMDLRSWTSVCTNQAVQGEIHFVDPEAPGTPTRFYRAIEASAPPQ